MPELALVPAGAGAGKTHRIKTALTEWVRTGLVRPERMLAVTFTDAAASELRQRIRASLLDAGLVDAALAVDRAYVSTIHALGLRILGEHALANGSSPLPRLLSDDERDLLLRIELTRSARLNGIGRELARHGYEAAFDGSETIEDRFRGQAFAAINLLRNLGERGRDPGLARLAAAAIRGTYGAPAGDGRALGDQLHRAVGAVLAAHPQGLAADATMESARRDFEGDHHALRRAADRAALDGDWNLWARLRKLRRAKRGAPTPAGYDGLADAVIAAADRLCGHPGPLEDACRHIEALIEGVQESLAGYAERKLALGVIDYADMVADAERLLRTDEGVLDAVLGEVDCVIVDEFQDTNPIQFAFLWRLARLAPRTLLVGDVKQAIMGFQGADARLMESLVAARRDAAAPLDRNWRSDPRIMGFVNALGPKLFPGRYHVLSPERAAGEDPALEVLVMERGRLTRSGSPRPEHHVAARLHALVADGATRVVDRRSGRPRAVEPRDIAVLCPTHNLAGRYAARLRDLGLPVRVSGTGWHASPVVAAARHALAFADDAGDRHAALCFAVLGPPRLSLRDGLAALVEGTLPDHPALTALRMLQPSAATVPVPLLLNRVIAAAGLRDWAERQEDPKQARADLLRLEAEAQGFVDAHRDMKAAAGFHGSGAKVFLGWLQARLGERDFDRHPDPGGAAADGIEVVTWHASKGREWPVVAVVGLDDDFRPRAATLTAEFAGFEDLDGVLDRAEIRFCPPFAAKETEEAFLAVLLPEAERTARRLLYVAFTRARDRLILEWPAFDVGKLGRDEKGAVTHARLLASACDVTADGPELGVGGERFAARIARCPELMPPAFDAAAEVPLSARGHRFGRRAIAPAAARDPGAPWLVLPSSLEAAGGPPPGDIRTVPVGQAFDVPDGLFAASTERGTALHQAMRVLMQRPDLKSRLAAHTGLDAATLDRVEAQAARLKAHLAALGYTRLACEVPLIHIDANGSTVSAIVDCIAEAAGGLAIIDHKSDPVDDPDGRFAVYWPQLAAYVDAVRRAWPEKTVGLVGTHWMTRGALSLLAV